MLVARGACGRRRWIERGRRLRGVGRLQIRCKRLVESLPTDSVGVVSDLRLVPRAFREYGLGVRSSISLTLLLPIVLGACGSCPRASASEWTASSDWLIVGRGSGWHGLATVTVSVDGHVLLIEQSEETGDWQSATLRLNEVQLRSLERLVFRQRLHELERSYSDGTADGTQWILLLRTAERTSEHYFDNVFPPEVEAFATGLDAILDNAGRRNLSWSPIGQECTRDHAQSLWDAIERR